MIDLTLNAIKIPDLRGYTPDFGTKVTRGIDPYTGKNNQGGLNVQQVNDNIIMPFVKMRGIDVNDTDSTSQVEFDAKLSIAATLESIYLTLGNGSYEGCVVTILNPTNLEHYLYYNIVSGSYTKTSTLLPNSVTKIIWEGNTWSNLYAPPVGKTITQYPLEREPSVVFPCTTWEEVTKFDGAFFRANGGSAAPFISENDTLTPQAQGTAVNGLSFQGTRTITENESGNPTFNVSISSSHGHYLQADGVHSGSAGGSNQTYVTTAPGVSGVFSAPAWPTSSIHSDTIGNVTVTGNHTHAYTPKGNIQSTSNETRPKNFTKKIWKRTA